MTALQVLQGRGDTLPTTTLSHCLPSSLATKGERSSESKGAAGGGAIAERGRGERRDRGRSDRDGACQIVFGGVGPPDRVVGGDGEAMPASSRHSDGAPASQRFDLLGQQLDVRVAVAQAAINSIAAAQNGDKSGFTKCNPNYGRIRKIREFFLALGYPN